MIIPTIALTALFGMCAPEVSPITLQAFVMTESGGHPYQVANISDGVSRSFSDKATAVNYLNNLTKENKRFSAGLMQIYSGNFSWLNLTPANVFDPCSNIKAGAQILKSNYLKVSRNGGDEQTNLLKSASMYYSGNEVTGFKKEKNFRNTSYVERVQKHVYTVPELKGSGETSPPPELNSNPVNIETKENKTPDTWDVFGDFKE